MRNRVVVTGIGVLSPNGHGLEAFSEALRSGLSATRFVPELEEYGFSCRVAAVPPAYLQAGESYFTEEQRMGMNSGIVMGCVAAVDAWKDAGLEPPNRASGADWDAGAILGTGIGGADTMGEIVPRVLGGKVRRLGSTVVEKCMASGVSACISGLFGLGNQVTTNSSACSTGTEAILMAADRIRHGQATRMLAGATEGESIFIWAGFDAMRVLNRSHNDRPEAASRPLSASAGGFVPAAGAAVLVLEDLRRARERGAHIYAEILGGAINCGGQRSGGSMTAANSEGVRRCIRGALADAGVQPGEIDAINGHLTATRADPLEIANWCEVLEVEPGRLPPVNSTKSMIGHALGASGALECAAALLELEGGFLHPSINCEDLHPAVEPYEASIVRRTREFPGLRTIAKASFGFGDVNSVIVFRRWED